MTVKTIAARALVLLACTGSTPVCAGWLEEIWDNPGLGYPSITVSVGRPVSITLPATALSNALATGLTTQQAVTVFLGTFGPKTCSDILDFNVPHAGMRIKLRRLSPAESNMHRELESEEVDLTVDYAPLVQNRCVAPLDQDAIRVETRRAAPK